MLISRKCYITIFKRAIIVVLGRIALKIYIQKDIFMFLMAGVFVFNFDEKRKRHNLRKSRKYRSSSIFCRCD